MSSWPDFYVNNATYDLPLCNVKEVVGDDKPEELSQTLQFIPQFYRAL